MSLGLGRRVGLRANRVRRARRLRMAGQWAHERRHRRVTLVSKSRAGRPSPSGGGMYCGGAAPNANRDVLERPALCC
jgi:hypothetical protein